MVSLIFLIMAVCFALPVVISWFFVSPDYLLPLLGLAAICRTILPLGIFLLMEYTTAFSIRDYWVPIAIGYLISVGVSVYQSTSR